MRRRHSRAAGAGVCLVVLLAAACTSSSGTDSPPPSRTTSSSSSAPSSASPPPKPALIDAAAVNAADPEAVAEAVATAAVTWDTSIDVSDFDGIRRAAALLTPGLAAQLAPVEHPASGPKWAEAASAQSYNSPSVYTAEDTHGAPPDTAAAVSARTPRRGTGSAPAAR